MHVLQHNPLSFFMSHVKECVGDNVLTLSQSDLVKLLGGVHSVLSGKVFDILDGVGTR